MYTTGPSTAATVTAALQVTSIFFQFRLGELVYLQLKFTLFTFPAFTLSCVCDHLLDISLIIIDTAFCLRVRFHIHDVWLVGDRMLMAICLYELAWVDPGLYPSLSVTAQKGSVLLSPGKS